MDCVRIRVISQLEAIMAKVEGARKRGEAELLNDAQLLLIQLHSSVLSEVDDPVIRLIQRYKTCLQDLDRAELLYASGFGPAELSSALGLSLRRVYQLLRLARLPAEVKLQIRQSGISERQLRPLLKQFESSEPTRPVVTLYTAELISTVLKECAPRRGRRRLVGVVERTGLD